MKILLSGASGMIGQALQKQLILAGHGVLRLVRREAKLETERYWNIEENIFPDAELKGVDVVIHLSGAGIADKLWSAKYKKTLVDSRVKTTNFLSERIASSEHKPKLFICASGLNIYHAACPQDADENTPAGKSFLSKLVQDWEQAASAASDAGIRTAFLRLGGVLSPEGGMLKKMLPVFRFGLGGRLGDGKQRSPWVAIEDVCSIVEYIIANEDLSGAINCCTSSHEDNRTFTKLLSKAISMPALIPAPTALLKLLPSNMADELLLADIPAVPKKLLDHGYKFIHPDLISCFNAQLKPEKPLKTAEQTELEKKEAAEKAEEETSE